MMTVRQAATSFIFLASSSYPEVILDNQLKLSRRDLLSLIKSDLLGFDVFLSSKQEQAATFNKEGSTFNK
eukprot:scaffold191_cov273-Chaetoceros_neogracile.AAC.42